LGGEATLAFLPQAEPIYGNLTHTVENGLHHLTKHRSFHLSGFAGFYLNARCASGSERAIIGRGFLNRKSSCRKSRWHWRTPSFMSNSL